MFKNLAIKLQTNKLSLDDPVYVNVFVDVALHKVRMFEALQIKLDINRLLTQEQSSEQCVGLYEVVI
jgi:hypothetical protein